MRCFGSAAAVCVAVWPAHPERARGAVSSSCVARGRGGGSQPRASSRVITARDIKGAADSWRLAATAVGTARRQAAALTENENGNEGMEK